MNISKSSSAIGLALSLLCSPAMAYVPQTPEQEAAGIQMQIDNYNQIASQPEMKACAARIHAFYEHPVPQQFSSAVVVQKVTRIDYLTARPNPGMPGSFGGHKFVNLTFTLQMVKDGVPQNDTFKDSGSRWCVLSDDNRVLGITSHWVNE